MGEQQAWMLERRRAMRRRRRAAIFDALMPIVLLASLCVPLAIGLHFFLR